MADQQDLDRIRTSQSSLRPTSTQDRERSDEHHNSFLQSCLKPTFAQDWESSDKYHNSFLIPKDDVLDAAVRNCTEQGLPNIAVSKAQGKFLHLLAKSIGAKKILEVGALGG